MPNKYFCQGPHCHEQKTTDRFLKSQGIIRGRYARLDADYTPNPDSYYYGTINMDKYFCSQGCANSWLAQNMESIQRRTLPPFIDHRRVTEGYEKSKDRWNRNTIQKIGVDNNTD
jgi:hypothetical protein